MTPVVQYIRKSLFFRLLAIFGITVVLFLIIILISLQSIGNDSDTIETIPDYFTRHVESIIEDIGTPPNLSNAMRLASELSWTRSKIGYKSRGVLYRVYRMGYGFFDHSILLERVIIMVVMIME